MRFLSVAVATLAGLAGLDWRPLRADAPPTSFEIAADAAREGPASVLPQSPTKPAPPRPIPAAIAPLLEAAGRYVLEFEERFENIVAEETYRQWTVDDLSTTRSDIVFVSLPGPIRWMAFRDVYEFNGRKVRDRDARLEELFLHPDSSTMDRAEAIRRESARFNLGPVYRDINMPTLPLAMLEPERQGRFTWERKGSRTFFGQRGVELRAVETARPTLVQDFDGSDVPAKVRFWIHPSTGRVMRTEARFELRDGGVRALSWIDTQYRPEPTLGLWVPESMDERYERGETSAAQARARYTNFRRFQVETAVEVDRVGP